MIPSSYGLLLSAPTRKDINPMRRRNFLFFALLLLAAITIEVQAGDWPQILGPSRNGVAVDEEISVRWPPGGPVTLWQQVVGSGFAGAAVSGDTVVVYHRVGREELVDALQRETGRPIWQSRFPADYSPSYSSDDGPRVVPLIHGERVYLHGALGELRCLDQSTGNLLWERKTFEEYGSKKYRGGEPPEGYFGVGSSPIVVGNKLIVNVGGEAKQAGIVAFDPATGKTVWNSTAERASYSSPMLVRADGTNHLVFATRLSILSLDPESGKVRFQFPFGRTGPTVTAANPVLIDGHVLITASYGIGSALVKIDGTTADLVWRDTDLLASQYTTCVEHEGNLYGIDGRQDGPDADLKCFDPFARETHWTEPAFGYATLLKVNNKLLALKTDGTLVTIAPSSGAYQELARTQILTGTARALPAVSQGRLYVRDTRVFKCIDLRPGS
jgi:outer membrane protein assembly factor BamB